MKLIKNYSQVPNPIFNYLLQLDMSSVAKDIVWLIVRLTYGFHKRWIAVHVYEIANRLGCQPSMIRHWMPRLVKLGVLLKGKYSGKSSRKYKPRYVYAVNPYLKKWAVFKRAGFYRTLRNDEPLPNELSLLADKYQNYFHQPPDEKMYNRLKSILEIHSSPRNILSVMKKAVRQNMNWKEVEKVLQCHRVGCPVKT
ncbi:MAG: replication protein [Elusimicrobia bacterium]|nr:replication protein [Elusimicrobiota bacterium]